MTFNPRTSTLALIALIVIVSAGTLWAWRKSPLQAHIPL